MTTYNIFVPVFATLLVEREDGMTSDEVIKSLTTEDFENYDGNDDGISEKIAYSVNSDKVEVEAID
jgi:hypothetical protein